MKKTTSIILILIFIRISTAQWEPDTRLTNDPAASFTSANNAWCIASNGNLVHAVWCDNRNGNFEIYYKRSTDAGVSWGTDTRLTINPEQSYDPSLSVAGAQVNLIWSDDRDGNVEVYYKRSTDNGLTWGTDTRLTSNPDQSFNPSLSASGLTIHVVWYDDRDGNFEIYHKRSTDAGLTWGIDTRLTNDPDESDNPSVYASGSLVNIVWEEYRDGNTEIYFKRSTNEGLSWEADVRLTNNPYESYSPSLSISSLSVHVVWRDNRDGNDEIYYKRSTNAGLNWEADTRLTNNTGDSKVPSVSASGSIVHIVWKDERDTNGEIYYKSSTNGGISWGADTRLTNNSDESQFPSLSVSGAAVNVVWYDHRDGNNEIYYKRNPTGNPVSINHSIGDIPKEFYLSQNFPNPFNPSTSIKFELHKSLYVKLRIYDVLGGEAAFLVNGQLEAGTYNINWNAAGYPGGVYYFNLSAGDLSQTRKMILIK